MLTRVCAGLAVGAVTLALTGCNGDDDLVVDTTPTEEATVPGDLDPGHETTDPEDEDNEVVQEFASDDECLADTWRLDNESYAAATADVFGDGGLSLDDIDGTVLMDLQGDGTFSTEYQNWTLTMSMVDLDGEGTIERDGVDSGTWSIQGSEVVIDETAADSQVSSSFEVDGQRVEMEAVEGTASAVETFTFVCETDSLTATTVDGTFLFTRD